ncbi:MAG: ACT domain-containing protein [Pseudomonadota bacterium]
MLTLALEPNTLAVYRFEDEAQLPALQELEGFVSLTRTNDEVSLVCKPLKNPGNCRVESDWRMLKVLGPLDFALTGILASLASPLAAADIPIFVISTFDTDYLLVKQDKLAQAIQVLENEGHRITKESSS